jgi:membrane-bound metal-dependent hydrolase YbcI (DUF457 family)
MAMFREHISVGAIVAAAVVAVVYFYALVTDPLMLAILFAVTTIASFSPDLDSDSGLPFHLIFGTFTVFCGGVALYGVLQDGAESWYALAGVPALVLLFVWFIVGGVFRRYTTHRGMMHSIPAAVILALTGLLMVRYLGHSEVEAAVFAVGVFAGFLSHLVLDEVYSIVDLEGIPFTPKRSLGTALKFLSSSTSLNVCTYTILAALTYLALQDTAVHALLLP